MAEAIIPRTQSDALNEASLSLGKAVALSDVLAMMASEVDVQTLKQGSLETTLHMLHEILEEANGFVDAAAAAVASRAKEVEAQHVATLQ
jgi:hypothetical protein